MAETERHAMATMDARQALGWHCRDRPDVYVGVDMLDELRFFDADSDAYLPTCEEAFERSAQLEEARREIAGLKAELAASKR
ncbi:MAG: hypothetical protein OXG74_08240 [Acidobacteria bacterium]|nr:hypothetical protein [Acidobacteriota bacterium]